VNKADVADPIAVDGLRLHEQGALLVSARTGEGLPALLSELERQLPRDREITVLVPYDRGDLIARAHQEGEVLTVTHARTGQS